jgi:hypothetical protein
VVATFLSQLPALLGVVVGTAGTIVATTIGDRARWRRNQSVRWDERRLTAYMEFAKALKDVHQLTFRLAAPRLPQVRAIPIDPEEGLELLTRAKVSHTKAWEAVLLLGDSATVSAARRWRGAVAELELIARGLAGDDVSWASTVGAANEARDEFYLAARAGLAVGSGGVAQAEWLSATAEFEETPGESASR